ncbi:hypothetical protein DPMN_111102 [Dreissena polymorpha]|uniref:Uncharacterized protein n=1 Tax=Dreissena polymorpha TaxID=45954 RepID=A0A9D4KEF1_DREPO|nr:hypothetical protein DPMN_111102 [Dreissena polymorpha]
MSAAEDNDKTASPRTPTELAREQKILEENIESLENLLNAISTYIPTAEEVDDWRKDVQNLTKTILNHKDLLKLIYREVQEAVLKDATFRGGEVEDLSGENETNPAKYQEYLELER